MANNFGLALAAGLANGYMTAQNRSEDRALQEKRFAIEQTRADREQQQYDEQRQLQQGLKDAATPRSAMQGQVVGESGGLSLYNKDTLTPALKESLQAEADMRNDVPVVPKDQLQPQVPTREGYGITGMSKGNQIVDKAPDLAALNSDDAIAKRQVITLKQAGKPLEAMSLKAAYQKEADDVTRRDLDAITTHEEMADWITKTKGDGQGGALKLKVVPSKDGKMVTYHKVNEDGTTTPTQKSFPNTEAGLHEARMTAARYMIPEMRDAHYKWKTESDRKTKDDDNKYILQSASLDAKAEHLKTLFKLAEATAQSKGDKFQASAVFAPLLAAASKSVHEAEKRIDDFQKDPIIKLRLAKPDSAESKQLQELKDDLDYKKREKKIYQSGLGGLAGLEPVAAPKPTGGLIPPLGAPKIPAAKPNAQGQFEVLQSEYNKTAQALEKAKAAGDAPNIQRATADLQSLEREAKGLNRTFEPTKPVGLASPTIAQAATAMTPSPSLATTIQPADDEGVRLDQSKAALRILLDGKRPGLASGRVAMDDYAKKVEQAREAVAQNEAAYAKKMEGKMKPAFYGQR